LLGGVWFGVVRLGFICPQGLQLRQGLVGLGRVGLGRVGLGEVRLGLFLI